MVHQLPELPYARNALEPHISAETLEYHYGKHHQTYVTNLDVYKRQPPDSKTPTGTSATSSRRRTASRSAA